MLTEEEIRAAISIDVEAISIVEEGFSSLAAGKVTLPPIMYVGIPENNGEVDIKSAYIQGYDSFAIKVSTGFFNNNQKGLPSGNGLMLLISTETGVPQALLLENGYLTHVRTACAGAIAAKYLAKESIEVAGVIGTGDQAYYQMLALKQVRDFRKLLVYGPTPERVLQFTERMHSTLGVEVIMAPTIETVVRESEVVVSTTPATTPLIKAEWLHPGLHITAMGADASHKQELEATILTKADLLVCDVKAQCFQLGELHHGLKAGLITEEYPIVEVGELTSGKVQGRLNADQITICDLTGTGVQDTAIARYAFNKLSQQGAGKFI